MTLHNSGNGRTHFENRVLQLQVFSSVLADLVSYVHRFFVGVEKERQKSSDDLLEGVVLEDSPR